MESLREKHNIRLLGLRTMFTNNIRLKIPWDDRLVGIIGSRGVGKTTLILQYIKEHYGIDNSALYVSLDDISFPYQSLNELVDEFVKRGGKHLFIDEIHKLRNWSYELKNIYDTYFDLNVVFTGSSVLDIEKGRADLSRRALIFHMKGLSFRQFLEIENQSTFRVYSLDEILSNHQQICADIITQVKPFAHFSNYLKHGYYPFYLQNSDFYSMRLSSVISQIIEVDIPSIFKTDISSLEKMKKFIRIVARNVPFKPNINQLSAAIGVSWQTTIQYINVLHQAQLINKILPAGKSVSTLSKPEKILLEHPNYYFLFDSAQLGSIRESFFVSQLMNSYTIEAASQGDFIVNGKFIFEIGGKNKTYHQIANLGNSYLVSDDLEIGYQNKIPLWLFGFLY